jgi:hypothetical protein
MAGRSCIRCCRLQLIWSQHCPQKLQCSLLRYTCITNETVLYPDAADSTSMTIRYRTPQRVSVLVSQVHSLYLLTNSVRRAQTKGLHESIIHIPAQPVMASRSHRTGGSAHSSVAMMPARAYASAANGSACRQQPYAGWSEIRDQGRHAACGSPAGQQQQAPSEAKQQRYETSA